MDTELKAQYATVKVGDFDFDVKYNTDNGIILLQVNLDRYNVLPIIDNYTISKIHNKIMDILFPIPK